MGSILLVLRENIFSFELSKDTLIILCSTFFLWGIPSSLLHNCAHHNIKPNWLNTVIGETIGSFMLYGFKGFRLGHLYHHKFPDNPMWDPHPPKGYNFIEFVMAPVKDTLKVIERGYYQNFNKNKQSEKSIKIQTALFYLSGLSRLFFWFALFKLNGFVFFYLPIYAGNIIVFAHINYATHVEREDGTIEIINLNHNLYYKIINLLSYNGYFHKSHHMRPQLFNPKKAKINDAIPYISYKPTL
jgi:fatty acid desaturase